MTQLRESIADGSLALLRSIRDLAHKAASATDFVEIATLVAETMQAACRPDSATIVHDA